MKNLSLLLALSMISGAFSLRAQNDELDKSFGNSGKATHQLSILNINLCRTLKIKNDGKILVLATAYNDSNRIVLMQLNADGSLDNTFNSSGYVHDDFGKKENTLGDVILHPSGKITIIGNTMGPDYKGQLGLLRLNSNGKIDSTFGINGKLIVPLDTLEYNIKAGLLQSNGKIIVGGYKSRAGGNSDFMVARLNADGSVDSSFGTSGKLVFGYSSLYCNINDMVLDGSGNIIITGSSIRGPYDSDMAVARITPNGTLDNNFSFDGKATIVLNSNQEHYAASILLQKDGKIVICGGASLNGTYVALVARMNTDGSIDNSFGSNGMVTRKAKYPMYVNDAILDSADRIFTSAQMGINNKSQYMVLAFTKGGQPEYRFGDSGIVITAFDTLNSETATSIGIQSDNKIVAAGISQTSMSQGKFIVSRYMTNRNLSISPLVKKPFNARLYPNPTTGEFTFSALFKQASSLTMVLKDASGRTIYTYFDQTSFTSGNINIHLEIPAQLTSGIYFLTVTSGNETITLPIVK